MSFPFEKFNKSNHNYLQKCFYVINLLKDKNYDLWENFHAQYCSTSPEESFELYQILVEEYQKILASERKPSKVRKISTKTKSASRKKAA